ncbi:MAG: hypothetical protein AAF844_07850 [Pseudomonadota bacterium]
MTAVTMILRASQDLPALLWAHWLLRLPLALIIFQQGAAKTPITAEDAASYGLPLAAWALAAFGEMAAGIGLVAGGFVRGWQGDLMTRLAGAALASIVVGVLIVVYWAPPLEILLYNQFHLLLLLGGLFFAFRGNRA